VVGGGDTSGGGRRGTSSSSSSCAQCRRGVAVDSVVPSVVGVGSSRRVRSKAVVVVVVVVIGKGRVVRVLMVQRDQWRGNCCRIIPKRLR